MLWQVWETYLQVIGFPRRPTNKAGGALCNTLHPYVIRLLTGNWLTLLAPDSSEYLQYYIYISRLRRTPSTHTLAYSHTNATRKLSIQTARHTTRRAEASPAPRLHHRIIKSNVCAGMKAWTELLYWTGYRWSSFVWQLHRQVIQHLSETTQQTSVPWRNGKWRTTEAIWLDHWSRVHRANRTSTNQCIL